MKHKTKWKILNGKYKEVEEALNELHKISSGGLIIKYVYDYCGSKSVTIVLKYHL